MAFAVVAYLAVACAFCYGIFQMTMYLLRERRLQKLSLKFEGPPMLPVIGNAHQIVGDGEYILSKLIELSEIYPSPSRVWLGPYLLMLITDPEQVKEVCLSPKTLGKGPTAEFFTSLAGTGLFTAPVSIWKAHRKLIQPTFNSKILDTFVEVFAAQAKLFTERIEGNLDGPEFEIFDLVSLCTLDMICETVMDVEVGAQANKNADFVQAEEKAFASFSKRFFSIWLYPDIFFFRTKLGKDQQKHVKLLLDFTDNVIKKKRSKLLTCSDQQDTADDENHAHEPTPRRKALLDHLMTLPENIYTFSDKALRHEVMTFVMAGHDTLAIAVAFVISMLASNPDVQEKVYQELYEIYGDHDVDVRPVEARDLSRMKYLECAIKETLRLFPPIPFFIRDVAEDVEIGDHTLPNGSTAFIGVLPLHRNEKYWPDPLKFNPDRFLPEEVSRRHPYAYIPFSAGPRNCVGLVYAMMSMKTLFATVLRRYILTKDDIVPVKDFRLKFESLLKPADPIKIGIQRRTRN